jgi:hypothetical protein
VVWSPPSSSSSLPSSDFPTAGWTAAGRHAVVLDRHVWERI